jgi:transposase-like protein
MSLNSHVMAAADDVVSPLCPLCHTVDVTVTQDTLRGGASWTCTLCGQRWSATRLEAVAAYARYTAPN